MKIKVNLRDKPGNSPYSVKKIQDFLNQAVKYLPEFKVDYQKFEISLVLTSSQKIRRLNKQYRKKDTVTDVLSFAYWPSNDFVLPDINNYYYLGEIVIAWSRLKKQAKENQITVNQEFKKLLIHGFLHLFGYDHEKDNDYRKMAKLEKRLVKLEI